MPLLKFGQGAVDSPHSVLQRYRLALAGSRPDNPHTICEATHSLPLTARNKCTRHQYSKLTATKCVANCSESGIGILLLALQPEESQYKVPDASQQALPRIEACPAAVPGHPELPHVAPSSYQGRPLCCSAHTCAAGLTCGVGAGSLVRARLHLCWTLDVPYRQLLVSQRGESLAAQRQRRGDTRSRRQHAA